MSSRKSLIKCGECGREFKNLKGLSSHVRQSHNLTSKEYYDKYILSDGENVCKCCGKPTNFANMTKGYFRFCSNACATSDEERNNKISISSSRPEIIEMAKKHITSYNKSDKGRSKSSEIGKISGRRNILKAHEKDCIKYCPKCGKETTHLIGIGCISCLNKSEEHKEKSVLTKVKSGKMSKYERLFSELLDSLSIEYIREYKEERYPYFCDFYLPKYDMFIELNIHIVHGNHFFNCEYINDIHKLEELRGKNTPFYNKIIKVWTEIDLEKKRTAEYNKLNYIVLWNSDDIERFVREIIT